MSKPLSKSKHRAVWNKTDGRCWYCGKGLTWPHENEDPKQMTNCFAVDHIVPRRQGGDNRIENLLPACWSCNSSKCMRTLEQFRRWLSAPTFTQEQIDWLASKGVALPAVDHYIFWGETFGVQP